jgi:hypothetical protein
MDWIKVYHKHLFGLTKLEKATLVEIQILTAFLERLPLESEMVQATSEHALTTLRHHLDDRSTTLRQVLDKVLEDVQDVADKRLAGRQRKQKWLSNHKNPTLERVPRTQGNEADKIREDKIREDKSNREGHNFVVPSFEEVSSYCLERKNGIDARSFIDFYSAKGWLIGKSKMKDWRACVRTWEGRTPKVISNKPPIYKAQDFSDSVPMSADVKDMIMQIGRKI